MPEIKTRDAVKGTIKTLDKAVIAGDRMKQVYVRTKDKAENSISASERNPEEYAFDRISGNADAMVHEAVHQFRVKQIPVGNAVLNDALLTGVIQKLF